MEDGFVDKMSAGVALGSVLTLASEHSYRVECDLLEACDRMIAA